MVYGIIQLINFAHGDIIMVGGYVVFVVMVQLGLRFWAAVILSIAVCTLLGVVIERLAYHRLLVKDAPRLSLLITAIGVSIFLQNLFQLGFTSSAQSMPVMFPNKVITLGSLQLSFSTVLNILVSIAMMILLELIVNKSKMGKAMRATSEDAGAAKLMGINTNSTIAFTFAIGSALAAVGAVLYSNTFHQITPYMGGMLGLKAFCRGRPWRHRQYPRRNAGRLYSWCSGEPDDRSGRFPGFGCCCVRHPDSCPACQTCRSSW